MSSVFLLYRVATFALFIVFDAIICSVAAWNLGFAQSGSGHLATLAQIDIFLIFAAASGLVVVFSVISVEVFRRGAISSRVWFELAWLTFFWVFNFVGAMFITAVAPGKLCSFKSAFPHTSSACTSSKFLIVFAWLNTSLLFLYFFLLTVFAIIHQKEDTSVWRSTVCDFPWFETKQCIRSVPNSPIISRLVKAKAPSLVVPKPRRAPPPPLFIHGRVGLGSRVEIEALTDVRSLEEQRLPSPPAKVAALPAAALSFYPQHVQASMKPPNAQTTYQSNTYYSSTGNRETCSPPPIRNWPRGIPSKSNDDTPSPTISERAKQKQRAAPPSVPSRSALNASSKSHSRAPPPPPLLTLKRTGMKETVNTTAPSSQNSPSRLQPTGPRTHSGSSGFVRPRPPPLDLTREGSTPGNARR